MLPQWNNVIYATFISPKPGKTLSLLRPELPTMVYAWINIDTVDHFIHAIFVSQKPGTLLRIWWTRHAVTNLIDREDRTLRDAKRVTFLNILYVQPFFVQWFLLHISPLVFLKASYRGSPHFVISQFVIPAISWSCFRPNFMILKKKNPKKKNFFSENFFFGIFFLFLILIYSFLFIYSDCH